MIAHIIGIAAASLFLLCAAGILAWHLLAPPQGGQHAERRRKAQHRIEDHEHEGYADNEQRLEELHELAATVDDDRRDPGGES